MRLLVFARKNPVDLTSSSTSSGFAAASDCGVGVGGEERGRHHVDPGVGALGRQDGGRQQLEGILEVQRAQLGGGARVDLGQALDGQAGPALRCPGLRHRFTVPGYVGRSGRCGHGGGRAAGAARTRSGVPHALLGAGRARASDHPPLPEPQLLAVTHPAEAPPGRAASCWPATWEGARWGAPSSPPPATARPCCTWWSTRPRGRPRSRPPCCGEPCWRRRRRRPVHLWVMQAGPADDDRAGAEGFAPERDLLQMRVALPLPDDVVAATRPLATRPFVPGRDEEAWVETNNRAFAGHPEQGGWTVAQLRERMAADWVELDGFLVADDPDGPGLIGACWTKIHRDRDSGPGRDLRDRRRPPAPRPGLGPLPHRGRAGAPGRSRHHGRDALHRRLQRGRGRPLPLARLHRRPRRPLLPARAVGSGGLS